jgi:glycosyltransferase involved in cell wall biosynthesis
MEEVKYAHNVSLITTVYNEAGNIIKFLDSYSQQNLYADEFIIIDGGSTDGTQDIISNFAKEHAFLRIKLIIKEQFNRKFTTSPISVSRNYAIENCSNEIIAVTDAGCTLDSNWLSEITIPFEDKETDVVSGWYEVKPVNTFQEIYCEMFIPKLETIRDDTFLPSSRSLAFRKKCWEEVGGYPVKDAYCGEDTKFDLDLKAAGFKFRFSSKAIVFWNAPKTLEEANSKHYYYGFGDGIYKSFKGFYMKRIIRILFPIDLIFTDYRKEKYLINFYMATGFIKGYLKG